MPAHKDMAMLQGGKLPWCWSVTSQLVAMTPLQHPGEGYRHAHGGSMIMLDLGGFFGVFGLF